MTHKPGCEALGGYGHGVNKCTCIGAQETSLEFVERMEGCDYIVKPQDAKRLIYLAKTAALIEEHRLSVMQYRTGCKVVEGILMTHLDGEELHTEVRAVADNIKEKK